MTADAGPIVYVDRSTVRPGKHAELQRAIGALAALVESNEPQILAYTAFLDADGATLTVIHVHADAASLERHFDVVASALPPFAELLEVRSMDIYGQPTEATLARLHEKGAMLGGLREILGRSFHNVELETVAGTAVFVATDPVR